MIFNWIIGVLSFWFFMRAICTISFTERNILTEPVNRAIITRLLYVALILFLILAYRLWG
jgi:hypothetical protein